MQWKGGNKGKGISQKAQVNKGNNMASTSSNPFNVLRNQEGDRSAKPNLVRNEEVSNNEEEYEDSEEGEINENASP